MPAGPLHAAARRAARSRPSRSPPARPRRSACARSTSPVAPGLTDATRRQLTNVRRARQLTRNAGSPAPTASSRNPAEPALPLDVVNVTPTDPSVVLRGVGFRGGTFTDSTVMPLTGAPTTELRGVHAPFVSPVFFPMRLANVNYFGALSGSGGTNLLVTPAQHRVADATLGTSTLRRYSNLDLRLFYSGNLTSAALSDAPTIVGIEAQPAAGGVDFTAQVVGDPAAAIHSVWVTYANGGGTWAPLDLQQCVAPLPGRVRHDGGVTALEGAARRAAGRPPVRRPGRQRPRPRLARRQPRRLLPPRRCGSGRGDDAGARLPAGCRDVRRQPDGHGRS